MRDVFFQFVCTESNTYSSYGHTTATYRPSESIGACFVPDEYSDDPDTSACMVFQHALLPSETTEQVPLTPTASVVIDTKDTALFNARVMGDNDEIWATEANHRTRWNKTFKSRLYGVILRDYPKQVVSLTKARSVPTNIRESLTWAQRHDRIDVTSSTVERKTGGMASAGTCPGGCKEFSHRGSNAHSIKVTCKICCTVRHPQRRDPATCSHRHTDHRESNAHTRKTCCVGCGTCIDSVPREIFNALGTTRSASSNRNDELADRVTKDTTITKQQVDLSTRMMLDQISRLSDGDYEQSMAIQLFLDCIDLATTPSTAFVSFREQPMHTSR